MRWRSVLFTPGTRPDRVRNALEAGAADVVVADLEDAVPPAQKEEARAAVADLLADLPAAHAVRAVRINPWPSALAEADLEAVLNAAPDLIVVPKAEDPAVVEALAARLDEADSDARLLLILETAAGVLAARELAAASDRVAAVAFGAEDLAADAGLRRSPSNWEVSVPRATVALAAAAAGGVAAIDMITADFRDDDRFRREAEEARALGYAGKMCLHPAQVAVAHEAFAPTPEEIAWAERVLAAVEAAGAGSGGVVVVDGKMVDVPLVEQARRIASQQG
ncbi:MAG: HpcH/HpaI aldolase/citrate lyase family protein [Thermoplasmatota archaeon]